MIEIDVRGHTRFWNAAKSLNGRFCGTPGTSAALFSFGNDLVELRGQRVTFTDCTRRLEADDELTGWAIEEEALRVGREDLAGARAAHRRKVSDQLRRRKLDDLANGRAAAD